MANKEVKIGDDWYLGENNDGDLIFYNARKDKVVKAIDVITGAEDKKGNSVNNLSSIYQGNGDHILQARMDGLIVPVAPDKGMLDAIDPSNTSTPVQDAIDVINALAYDFGEIYYPPGTIETPGEITNFDHIYNYGTKKTVIKRTTAGNDLLDVSSAPSVFDCLWDTITFDGNGADGNPALDFSADDIPDFHLNKVIFQNFDVSSMVGGTGIINWTGGAVSGHWGVLKIESCIGNALGVNSSGKGTISFDQIITNMNNYGRQLYMGAGGQSFHGNIFKVEGKAGRAAQFGSAGSASIDLLKIAPTADVSTNELVQVGSGPARRKIGTVVSLPITTVDQIVNISSGADNFYCGALHSANLTVNNSYINITGTPSHDIHVDMPVSYFQNDANSVERVVFSDEDQVFIDDPGRVGHTYTIGSTGDYATVRDALLDLRNLKLKQVLTLELQENVTESEPIETELQDIISSSTANRRGAQLVIDLQSYNWTLNLAYSGFAVRGTPLSVLIVGAGSASASIIASNTDGTDSMIEAGPLAAVKLRKLTLDANSLDPDSLVNALNMGRIYIGSDVADANTANVATAKIRALYGGIIHSTQTYTSTSASDGGLIVNGDGTLIS